MNKNHLVTQSNSLVDARYHEPLSARQQKIVLSVVSKIQIDDEDFKIYEVRIRDFHEMLGLEGEPKYTEMKKITEELLKKSLEITREKGRLLQVNWFSSIEYFEHEGRIEFSFDPKLKPYLLDLKKAYTSYRLSNILSLSSASSIRLYELMKKWEYLGKWEITIEKLKDRLGVKQQSYNVYGNFKNRIIVPSINELNEKTDIQINFKEIKKGRKVIGFEFTIRHSPEKEIKLSMSEKKEAENPKLLSKEDELRNRLNAQADGYQFDTAFFAQLHQGASLIWKEDAEKELEFLIRYVNEEQSVKNPLGFIKAKITSAWDVHEAGGHITFADLQPMKERPTGRQERLPDWFTSRDQPKVAAKPNPEFEKEKEETLKRLAAKKRKDT
ncbi:replication initiation protein [Planococcus sp. S3-L1]|uniref:replication initiation protein n=1 Tax=Planococcus sp. S3-L1 TaxID=3046200 RepID=UPI0024B9F2CB|nr:replication initiation protein [Planococcus sp. S3-L1]MDJ0333529.1 replication initiation protein [Planococcus sp. S3-L1]